MPIDKQFRDRASPAKLGKHAATRDSDGNTQTYRAIAADQYPAAIAFLLDWLDTQLVLAPLEAVGHRVVHGMAHTEPERITPELLDELRRIAPYDPEHLLPEIRNWKWQGAG